MNNKAKIRIAIKNFVKNQGKVIFIVFIIWLIIFLINQYLKTLPKKTELSNTYNPDSPIMDETTSISKSDAKNINEFIKKYIDYCNAKDYDNAYNMISTSCKKYVYNDNEDNFKKYVDEKFEKKRIYYTQNYSNVDGIYVYILTLIDDIESTGTTGGFYKYSEKIAIFNEENDLKISNDNFIITKEINKIKEDDYMKVEVVSKDIGYDTIAYNLKITNKTTDGFILISDATNDKEVSLTIGNQDRGALNLENAKYYIEPGKTEEMYFTFTKYFDEKTDESRIQLNDVRILKTLNNKDSYNEALKVYSFNIDL